MTIRKWQLCDSCVLQDEVRSGKIKRYDHLASSVLQWPPLYYTTSGRTCVGVAAPDML